MTEHPACIADQIKLYINTYMDYLKSPEKTRKQANALYQEIRGDLILNGKNPKSVAAAVVYIGTIIAGEPVPQQEIAWVAGISETTIRNVYTAIAIYLQLLDRESRYYSTHVNPKIRDTKYVPPD
jgi:transcription initiation factor TFIIIB Brf1 subunit/transcription initiation factor TFIIB